MNTSYVDEHNDKSKEEVDEHKDEDDVFVIYFLLLYIRILPPLLKHTFFT